MSWSAYYMYVNLSGNGCYSDNYIFICMTAVSSEKEDLFHNLVQKCDRFKDFFTKTQLKHHPLYVIHPVPSLCQINIFIPAVSSNFLLFFFLSLTFLCYKLLLGSFSQVKIKCKIPPDSTYWKKYLNYTDFFSSVVWKFGERAEKEVTEH